jgi:hypothetical protein
VPPEYFHDVPQGKLVLGGLHHKLRKVYQTNRPLCG